MRQAKTIKRCFGVECEILVDIWFPKDPCKEEPIIEGGGEQPKVVVVGARLVDLAVLAHHSYVLDGCDRVPQQV